MQTVFGSKCYQSAGQPAAKPATVKVKPSNVASKPDDDDDQLLNEGNPDFEFNARAGRYEHKAVRMIGGIHTNEPGAVGALNNCLFDQHGRFVRFAPGTTKPSCPFCSATGNTLSILGIVVRCDRGHFIPVPQNTPGSIPIPMRVIPRA